MAADPELDLILSHVKESGFGTGEAGLRRYLRSTGTNLDDMADDGCKPAYPDAVAFSLDVAARIIRRRMLT